MTDEASYRLPPIVRPERYRLELEPDLGRAAFSGTVSIDLSVDEAVEVIVLNAAELEIDSVELQGPSGPPRTGQVELDLAEERAILRFAGPVEAGHGYRLDLSFRGILNDKLAGFYRSTFTDPDGHDVVIATTQFESTDARRAFPCFDEPAFKARFAVSLVIDERLTALSNGATISEEPAGAGRRRVTFAETMPMSTYLVAFVVGPFELTEPVDVDGVPFRIASPPGKSHLTAFSTEVGSHALRFLARYFDIPYPSDKIDHVAIPDFAFGAMENLGCVTYRESVLLVDPAAASQLELQRVAAVVSHETAHMWFGDLVTMKWWSGIWLNEAFATFMEVITTDDLKPEWDVWTAFGAGKAAALAVDGLHATRPVEFEVGRPEEAEAMFDVLTYQKGGAVLRMLEQYLGAEVFRLGIARYLKEHRYGNTITADLWAAIEAESHEPVGTIMDSWIFQGGYPLVSVTGSAGSPTITLSQQRFLYAGDIRPERWVVPVNLRASVGGQIIHRRVLLDGERAEVNFDGPVDWVVVNEGGWGFYRIRYTPELLGQLTTDLSTIATPLERMGIISDTWASVVAGGTSLETFVGLVSAPSLVDHEQDPDVWSSGLGPLRLLDTLASDTDRPAVAAFVRRVAGPAFARVGWDPQPDEDQRTGITRSRLLSSLGGPGADGAVRAEATRRVEQFFADGSGLAPDVVTAALHTYVEGGGDTAYRTVLARYRDTDNPQDKNRYLYTLAAASDQARLLETLELCVTNEVRSQDAPFVIASVLSVREGAVPGWEWVEARWDELTDRFARSTIVRMLEGVSSFSDPDLVARVHRFLASHSLSDGPRVAQLEERMDVNVAFARRVAETLGSTLGPA